MQQKVVFRTQGLRSYERYRDGRFAFLAGSGGDWFKAKHQGFVGESFAVAGFAPVLSIVRRISSAQDFCGSHIDPVVQKDLFEITCGVGIVDDQPRIAIVASTQSRPILAADDHDLGIDDDAFVVDV